MSSPNPAPTSGRDPWPRLMSSAALLVALIALVFSMGGRAPAKKGDGGQRVVYDDVLTSGAEEFPDAKNGIKDKHEMTFDLTTTASGARAAGSQGVTVGSKGNGNLGEPDPVPMPADPLPETLNYVTVYDNHDIGSFAGGAQGRVFGD